MGIAATVVAGIGTAVNVFGAIRGAAAESKATAYQADLDAYNAEVARRMAMDSRSRGVVAVQESQLQTQGLIGTQQTVLSERNIDISSGSALAIIGDTARFGAMDAATIKSNYEREAIGFETQQAGFNASSQFGYMAARDVRRAGVFNAFSTALGGTANAISLLPRFQA